MVRDGSAYAFQQRAPGVGQEESFVGIVDVTLRCRIRSASGRSLDQGRRWNASSSLTSHDTMQWFARSAWRVVTIR